MKILMEQWRQFIKEATSDVLYHYANGIEVGVKVLKDNRFLASGGFTKDVEVQFGKGKLYYFSTARTPVNAYTGDYPQGVIFRLDGRKLGQKYKSVPIDYYGSKERSSKKAAAIKGEEGEYASEGFESEDRVLLNEPYVENAEDYIEEMHVAIPLYQEMFGGGKKNLEPVRSIQAFSLEAAKEISELAKAKGIPVFYHISKLTWPQVEVGKKKALTSYEDLMAAVEKSGAEIGDQRTGGKYTSPREVRGMSENEDRVDMFVQMAEAILAGETELEPVMAKIFPEEKKPGDIYTGLKARIDDPEASTSLDYDEYARKIETDRKAILRTLWKETTSGYNPDDARAKSSPINNELHNLSKEAGARKTIAKLGNLLRRTKQKSMPGFMAVVNQAYRKNRS